MGRLLLGIAAYLLLSACSPIDVAGAMFLVATEIVKGCNGAPAECREENE